MGIENLLKLSGIELIDATAGMLGQQPPSQLSRPLTTPEPKLIKPTQDEWWRAADQVTAHIEAVRTQLTVVSANWDVPPSFTQYMNKIVQHLEAQQTAMHGVAWQLNAAAEILDAGKKETKDKISEVAAGLVAALATALAMALVSGTTAGAIGVGIAAGIIAALIQWLVNRRNLQRKQLEEQSKVVQSLEGLIKGQQLKNITPPPAPDLKGIKGFSSIHDPNYS
ncbi:hypothetical protein [Spirillospora sp. NPDC029432]|uniref:hypothetical protein n=1 Tax=Spirillospora sp. NPDC029432 TaxID=3154599 RepID=UPI0034527752